MPDLNDNQSAQLHQDNPPTDSGGYPPVPQDNFQQDQPTGGFNPQGVQQQPFTSAQDLSTQNPQPIPQINQPEPVSAPTPTPESPLSRDGGFTPEPLQTPNPLLQQQQPPSALEPESFELDPSQQALAPQPSSQAPQFDTPEPHPEPPAPPQPPEQPMPQPPELPTPPPAPMPTPPPEQPQAQHQQPMPQSGMMQTPPPPPPTKSVGDSNGGIVDKIVGPLRSAAQTLLGAPKPKGPTPQPHNQQPPQQGRWDDHNNPPDSPPPSFGGQNPGPPAPPSAPPGGNYGAFQQFQGRAPSQLNAPSIGWGFVRQHAKSFIMILVTGGLIFTAFNSQLIIGQVEYLTRADEQPEGDDSGLSLSTVFISPDPRIIIPKINLDVPVVYDEPSYEEAKVQAALERGVVHYGNTAVPGENGNNVIVGHSSNNWWAAGDYKFAFVLLDKLEVGDTYVLNYNSRQYIYEVFRKDVVEPTDLSVLEPVGEPIVTLITCTPPGTSWKRLVVQARQISPDPNYSEDTASQESIGEIINNPLPGSPPAFWDQVNDQVFGQ